MSALLQSCRLDSNANIQQFDCSNHALNEFLKVYAAVYDKRRFGVTITFHRKNDSLKKVIAYYTVAPGQICRDSLPVNYLSGPRPNHVPMFRLGQLAVDKQYQSQGIGRTVLLHALKKCYLQSLQIGGYGVIVDAKDENVRKFYEKMCFVVFRDEPLSLGISMKVISGLIEIKQEEAIAGQR